LKIVGEIKFLCAEALRPAIEPLILQFQEVENYEVVVDYANVGTITDRLRKGEIVDLAVVSPEQWRRLSQETVLLPNKRAPLAHIGIALAVRAGARKPDVSSIASLKRALLDSHTIAIIDPAKGSPSGIRAIRLFELLGIAAEVQSRVKLVESSDEVFRVLTDGEADLGINQASEVAAHPKIDSAGRLPDAAQFHSEFVAGIPTTAPQADGASKLIEFLVSPRSAALFGTKEIGVGEVIQTSLLG
jgi:molybdate transport system substrate-binding protein